MEACELKPKDIINRRKIQNFNIYLHGNSLKKKEVKLKEAVRLGAYMPFQQRKEGLDFKEC
jgi:hypothetical protein